MPTYTDTWGVISSTVTRFNLRPSKTKPILIAGSKTWSVNFSYSFVLGDRSSRCVIEPILLRKANPFIAQPGTNGFFLNEYNVPGRTIVGLSNFSPAFFLREKQVSSDPIPLKNKLPDIYSWSDIVWVCEALQNDCCPEVRIAKSETMHR